MKRVIGIVGGLAFAFFLGRWLFIALASDETRIRWLVERMEQGYNRADVGDCVGPLADDWSHEGYAVDRDLIANAIRADYLRDRDRETKELRRRVDVDEETLDILVDGEKALLSVEVSFERLDRGEWAETWALRAAAELRATEDGWRIHRTRHEDLRGTQLSR